MEKLVVATTNKGKIKEFNEILGDRYELVSLSDIGFSKEIEENGSTFEENAFIKAKAVFDYCGKSVLADDSGLVVPSLNGEPGVFSARYAGDHDMEKNKKLLLKNLVGKDRKAHFTCALCLYTSSGVIFAEGKTFGQILCKETGAGGFGYDPLFFSEELQKSFGECSSEEKNSVSHRKKAIENLLKKL